MDLRQLKYFARIVELESMTAAAHSLYVAQPSLSQHIANLEASVGTQLLVRSVHGTRPTAAGELLYKYAKTILRQVEEAGAALKQGAALPARRVSVGMPFSTLQRLGQPLVTRLREADEPAILLELIETSNSALAEQAHRQRLDVAIIADVRPGPQFDAAPLLTEELLLFGPADAALPDTVDLSILADLPLTLPAFPNSVRAKVENACLARQLGYQVAVESASAALMVQLAQSGQAWTVLPWAAAQGLPGRIRHARFAGMPLQRTLSLCVGRHAAACPATQAVRQTLAQLAHEQVEAGDWHYARLPADPGDASRDA